jgi:hypothetical protein
VTWEEINTMFSNIEDIWTLSKAFLEKLEQRARSWQDKETDEGHSDPIISDILIETVRLDSIPRGCVVRIRTSVELTSRGPR